jgi:hypothetical protein
MSHPDQGQVPGVGVSNDSVHTRAKSWLRTTWRWIIESLHDRSLEILSSIGVYYSPKWRATFCKIHHKPYMILISLWICNSLQNALDIFIHNHQTSIQVPAESWKYHWDAIIGYDFGSSIRKRPAKIFSIFFNLFNLFNHFRRNQKYPWHPTFLSKRCWYPIGFNVEISHVFHGLWLFRTSSLND